jgi:polyisoprenoid-binding protein YceI
MRISSWKSFVMTLGAIAGIAIFLSAVAAPPKSLQAALASEQEVVLMLDPAPTKLQWTVDSTLHTVHGTFAVKSGTIHFDPETGKAGGAVIVLATSGDSGNSSRDERMHKEILETAEFPDAVLRPCRLKARWRVPVIPT